MLHAVIYAQKFSQSNRPRNPTANDVFWTNANGPIWIPDTASDLQLRLGIILHTELSGRRDQSTTETVVLRHSFWLTIATDIQSFARACIKGLSTADGTKVPRPFGWAVHGTEGNNLLQFDYIEVRPRPNGEMYVLMLRGDLSYCKWVYAVSSTLA